MFTFFVTTELSYDNGQVQIHRVVVILAFTFAKHSKTLSETTQMIQNGVLFIITKKATPQNHF